MSASRRLVHAAARMAFPRVDPTRRAVIIGYHSIHPSAPYASATPAEFEQHLDWLQAHCSLVALDRIRVPLGEDRPRVALTFDDGFVDNFESAFPSLHARGITATFFITIGFVDRTPDVLARMARLCRTPADEITPLDWGEVGAMHRSGMAFGSHTMSHPNLAAIDGATARRELRDSKHRLEDRLQAPIASLAYPFGKLRHHVTSQIVDLARESGYEQAVSTHARAIADSDDDMCLPRIVIGNDTVSQLAEKVVGTIDWHAHVRERMPRALSERSFSGSALTMPSDVADAPAVEPDNAPRVVSVIITSYNYGRFLSGAIESVLAQTYSPLDIVVVDDGSTDETPTIARTYADRGVAYVSTPRVGAARARNAGIGVTAGPLVAFLDADDTWLPNKIERQVAHLRRHPEIALVSCHAYACDEQMQRESIVHAAEEPSRWMLERLLVHNVVLNPTCVLVRRPVLERVGGFSDLRKWEDWDTWLRIAKLSRLGFIPEVLAEVRRHRRGLSPQDGYEHLALDEAIFDRHIMDVASPWKRRVLRRRARSVSYFHVARLMADHDRAAARRFSVRSLLLDPTILTRRKVASVVRTHFPVWSARSLANRARSRAGS